MAGYVYVRYAGQAIAEIVFTEAIDEVSFYDLKKLLTLRPLRLGKAGGFTIELVQDRTGAEKLVHFCMAYRHYRGVPYHASEQEKANIKLVPVNEKLLEVFFKSTLNVYTLTNYIRRINVTRDYATNGIPRPITSQHPPVYDAEYERKLSPSDVVDYHSHLQSLGFVKKYNPARGSFWTEKDE